MGTARYPQDPLWLSEVERWLFCMYVYMLISMCQRSFIINGVPRKLKATRLGPFAELPAMIKTPYLCVSVCMNICIYRYVASPPSEILPNPCRTPHMQGVWTISSCDCCWNLEGLRGDQAAGPRLHRRPRGRLQGEQPEPWRGLSLYLSYS